MCPRCSVALPNDGVHVASPSPTPMEVSDEFGDAEPASPNGVYNRIQGAQVWERGRWARILLPLLLFKVLPRSYALRLQEFGVEFRGARVGIYLGV